MRYEVRGVLAAAYAGRGRRRAGLSSFRNLEGRTLLTHVVVLDAMGRDEKVLCRGVALDHMCDQAEMGPPSCPKCLGRLMKAFKKTGEKP